MLAKYFSVLAATAAAVCAQYSGPATTMCTNSCNPLITPSRGQAVPAGAALSITWTPTTTGPVAIELLRGPSDNVVYLSTIVGSTANSGSFSWSVPTTLEPDVSHYGIRLISLADGTFQYSDQFGISNPGYSGAGSSSASSSVVVSSTASSTASGSAVVSPSAASNATESSSYTISAPSEVFSTGSPYSNSSILSASPSISLPTTLESAAATTAAGSAPASKTSASATAKASSGADSIKMSIGGAVVAVMAAVAAL